MRFIVDESSGKAVAQYLKGAGHDVHFVGDIMPQADDDEILELALDENRILITNDKDFGELVFRGGFEHHGVLLLRLQDERPNHRAQVVASVLKEHAERLVGNFAVATKKSFRIRAKP